MVDAISDMLTRIRNAQAARHASVTMPASKVKFAIARVLEREGFVGEVTRVVHPDNEKIADLTIMLEYIQLSHARKTHKIRGLQQVSKQGQRRYVRNTDIHEVKNGHGISIISTSQGVMTGAVARKKGLGGEMICKVW